MRLAIGVSLPREVADLNALALDACFIFTQIYMNLFKLL